eukprot:Skav233011  [mRNA]  locus=scaffold909:66844:68556:+ [translate_table: standard]
MDPVSGLAGVWALLRETGLQHVAPVLVRCGVRSCGDLIRLRPELQSHGLDASELELLCSRAGGTSGEPTPGAKRRRHDMPLLQDHGRASFQLALQAASFNNREQALVALESAVLAPSTTPAVASRVRTYQDLCRAWNTEPWPISQESLRCFAASLKAGRYRSSSLYFSTIFSHQQRCLAIPVDKMLHSLAKDYTRSITRGMGPSKLKDAFDLSQLAKIPPNYKAEAFSIHDVKHVRDVCILAGWYMLRELELASAEKGHLYIQQDLVNLLIPQHKTDQRGSLTVRSLRCPCRAMMQPMCPFHAAFRHLNRLVLHSCYNGQADFPLVPDEAGHVMSKSGMIDMFRSAISACGVPLQRVDDRDKMMDRFHGHVLRVSGAQFLAMSNISLANIQLLGRWSSSAVERYTQQAPLVQLPNVVESALRSGPSMESSTMPAPSVMVEQVRAAASSPAPRNDSANTPAMQEIRGQIRTVAGELAALKTSIVSPDLVLVHRKRSRILHMSGIDESANDSTMWRTKCGWNYGCSIFFRASAVAANFRKCRKCWRESTDDGSASESSSSGDASSDSSSDDA